uniref:Secreted protein n=1 Tax=Trichuris muris TaxID=70415 RepID=A0A5S6R0U6_TRIMR
MEQLYASLISSFAHIRWCALIADTCAAACGNPAACTHKKWLRVFLLPPSCDLGCFLHSPLMSNHNRSDAEASVFLSSAEVLFPVVARVVGLPRLRALEIERHIVVTFITVDLP